MRKIKRSIIFKFRLFMCLIFVGLLTYSITAYISTYANFLTVSSSLHTTGIDGTTVYLNDVEKDWYYYNGLNYTASSTGTLPTGNKQSLYSEKNLAFVSITYSATDFNTNLTGTVSTASGENQNTYIYYKVMPVNNNGTTEETGDDYVLIELIDNPFTNRPTNKAFNGWVTNYSGAKTSYDSDYYIRYAKVPVTYTNNKPDNVVISFTANWVDATVATVNNNTSWTNAIGSLKTAGIKQLETIAYTYQYFNMDGYYKTITINQWDSCNGYYNFDGSRNNNNCMCWDATCTYLRQINNGENYNSNTTYYSRINRQFSILDPSTLNLVIASTTANPEYTATYNMASYYRKVNYTNGQTYSNVYTTDGTATSGTCSNTNGCSFYELIQYRNSNNELELYDSAKTYYYLVTRDTNILILGNSRSDTWSSSETKPFTLTGIYNGTNQGTTWSIGANNYYDNGVSVVAYNDLTIENITVSAGSYYTDQITNPTSSSSGGSASVLGKFHNVKMGRGITRNGTYRNFTSVVGGGNSGSNNSSDVKRYRLMIESGFYNSLSIANGATTGTNGDTVYIESKAVYGNDYDRANNNNSKLDVYYCASGSWGDNYYAPTTATGILFDLTVKNGSFGSSHYDYSTGIYVGGRYGGVHYNARRILVEGGYIYNLIGGPLTAANRASYNDAYIFIAGGEIDMVTGGAGETATYGNRIIQITGGKVNYSVFGGSNGFESADETGTVNGSSLIYVGGNSVIGSTTNITNNNTLYNAEAGSVFGIGNGRVEYPSIGSSDNSHIILADNAIINRNVYGGGNFATVGVSSTSSTTSSKIDIIGGTVNGSVYGGGNNNGAGSDDTTATVNIKMTDGTVNGSIYGGANQLGVIFGSTSVNIVGGTVLQSVYGGGQGGFSTNSAGTYVSRGSNVTIGLTSSPNVPTIGQNVFGGSAYGTVNGTTRNNTLSSYNTSVTVNKGTIMGSVFGGGKGDNTYDPYVKGNIDVIINGGDITNVFGGNDANGVPNGYVKVYLKGGTVDYTFGGGNASSVTTSNVYLQGGSSTYIYGGSNTSGNVTTSNVTTTTGTATTIYGGNNEGGTTTTSHVTIGPGGTIENVYGGGRLASTDTTNVVLNGSSISYAYGGGESANVTTKTNVALSGGTSLYIFGGSNTSGTVKESVVSATSGNTDYIYGGNNVAGQTTTTSVSINGATINENVYGGGNNAQSITTNVHLISSPQTIKKVFGGGSQANVGDQVNSIIGNTHVTLEGATVTNIFGGSDTSGVVDNSHVSTISGTVTNLYGGNNDGGSTTSSNVTINGGTVSTVLYGGGRNANSGTTNVTLTSANALIPNVYGGGHQAPVNTSNVTLTGVTVTNLYGGGNQAGVTVQSNVYLNGGTTTTVFGGSNNAGIVEKSNIRSTAGVHGDIYGSNNYGGKTIDSVISLNGGSAVNVYGGGNEAQTNNTDVNIVNTTITGEVYGGGNQAGIETTTSVLLNNSNVTGSIYGGGNAGTVATNTYLHVLNTNVGNSIYAGGNGVSAIVYGHTVLDVDGTTTVANHVFGGGNAAATGTAEINNSSSSVNIAGATIGGNVYGGANTSVLYGTTVVNIGKNVATNGLNAGNINITGTVFGGGEANAAGSEIYDFRFISVTNGIVINIDGADHNTFTIGGSIFGSGNASSTTGSSYVNISNYGSQNDIKRNVSIQRATLVTIKNSVFELIGAADRTNDYNTTKFSFSRVDGLKIKNGTILYLKSNANLLLGMSSLVDINSVETKGAVSIVDGTVTKNVDNRIYMYEGQNLNVATEQNASGYGDVSGMSFFGMYNYDREGFIKTAMYSPEYESGDMVPLSEIYNFDSGSYILGMHKANHDTTVDGFYSNFNDEENDGKIQALYIDPTPEDAAYYMWVIGESVVSFEVQLTASKYSTLGAVELALPTLSVPNTIFNIVGFSFDDLDSNITLVDYNDIPRVASSDANADNVMGLAIKSGPTAWITNGTTSFFTDEDNLYSGTTTYYSENSSSVPSFVFFLYHSKNLATSGDMGTVTISLRILIPTDDDLQMDIQRININVNLNRALFASNEYEGTITPGKKYEMFATTPVNITNTSSFSTYYSLFLESDTNVYRSGYHRALVSNYVLPEETKITMIDFADTANPEYYYYVITAQDVIAAEAEMLSDNEVSYELSKFLRMGSNSSENHYDDAIKNDIYYDEDLNAAQEEFIFMLDFGESNINTDVTNKYLFIELRDRNEQTIISVLGVEQATLIYNLYNNKDAIINVNGTLSSQTVYVGDTVKLSVETNFTQQLYNSLVVNDTNYEDQQLGVKITIFDQNGNIVNGASLMGISFTYNGVTYYPRVDGSVRIRLAERMANVLSRISINAANSNLATGTYTLRVESFGSPDGIYYGLTSSNYDDVTLTLINKIYGLSVSLPATQAVIDHTTGYNLSGTNNLMFNINYSSGLTSPNIRLTLYRRDYSSITTTAYNKVDLADYVTNLLTPTSNQKEYKIIVNPTSQSTNFFYLKNNLVTGTYKFVFSLYDENRYIGDMYRYVIIK